jgi:tRNA(Ile2) C34 agmatinyltransferase TiaS
MMSWFGLTLALLVVLIAYGIVRSVRAVMSDMDRQMKGVPRSEREAAARELTERLRQMDVRCPRCGEEAFLVLGTSDGYRCERCSHEFSGPAHPRIGGGR